MALTAGAARSTSSVQRRWRMGARCSGYRVFERRPALGELRANFQFFHLFDASQRLCDHAVPHSLSLCMHQQALALGSTEEDGMDTGIAVEFAGDGRIRATQRWCMGLGFSAFVLVLSLGCAVAGVFTAPDVALLALCIVLALCVCGAGHWWIETLAQQCSKARLINSQLQARLHDQMLKANYDGLTGFPNERLLSDRFNEALLRARRQKSSVVLYQVTLADMEAIIRYHGGAIASHVIRQLGERLSSVLRATDSIVRLRNSDYVLILELEDKPKALDVVSQKIMRMLSEDFVMEGPVPIRAHEKVAMAQYPQDGQTLDALMSAASARMASRATLSKWTNQVMHGVGDGSSSRFEFLLKESV